MANSPTDGDRGVRVRMAPSPTGPLHIGTARTSLYNYLFARHVGGTYVLRIEDTDAARGSDELERDIIDHLHWLGISWDEGPEVAGGAWRSPRRRLEAIGSSSGQTAVPSTISW